MQVSIEKNAGLECELRITIPKEEFQKTIAVKTEEAMKTAKVPGFRAGKVSPRIVMQQYGESIKQDAISKLVRESLDEAFKKEHLHPVSMPVVTFVKTDPTDCLEYTAVFEVLPDVKLADYSKMKIEKMSAEVTDADIDEMLKKLQKQHVTFEAVDRPSKMDDQVTIDFIGTVDGKQLKEATANDFSLVLGENRMILGFEEGLVAKTVGQSFELNLTFPEGYHNAELSGKPVIFQCTMKKVEAPKYPALDDAFAKNFKIDSGLTGLKDQLRENMQETLKNKLLDLHSHQVLDQLLELTPLEIPKAMIKEEIDRLKHELFPENKNKELHKKAHALPDDLFEKKAQRNVHLRLIFSQYLETHQVKANPEKTKEKINLLSKHYEKPEEVVGYYYQNPQLLKQVESMVLEEQIIDDLMAGAQLTEKHLSYTELMAKGNHDHDATH